MKTRRSLRGGEYAAPPSGLTRKAEHFSAVYVGHGGQRYPLGLGTGVSRFDTDAGLDAPDFDYSPVHTPFTGLPTVRMIVSGSGWFASPESSFATMRIIA